MTTAAKTAYDARDWQGVVDSLDGEASLSSDDLLIKGDALYWLGEFDASIEALERAYAALAAEERSEEAGLVASILGYISVRRQAHAVAAGWKARAEHLLEGKPPSMAHVWLTLLQMGYLMFVEGDPEAGMRKVEEALELSKTVGSKSGQSFAMSVQAWGLTEAGRWRDAIGLVDEAAVMAMTVGEDLRITSDVYCNTISICRDLADYRRAGEWTEQAERWMRNNSVTGYTGTCAVHRAELKRLHGSWQEAEDEARKACVGLEKFHFADYVGLARYEIGEIRRRMGDLDGAQESFEQAYENGHDAQPGMSLLLANRGDIDGAYKAISAAMGQHPRDDENPAMGGPSRARLIPAFVEIALGAGDHESALSAIEDFEMIAEAFDSKVWRAGALTCRGAYLLNTGSADSAIDALSRAWRLWREVDLPYEMGLARAMLGQAKRATGDEAGAGMELKAALAILQKLGARTEVARVQGLLGLTDGGATSGNRVVRTFMFTDIVGSTDLVELIGDGAWQDLLGWHDRTLRQAIDAAGGEEVAHTGDGFFAAFADPRAAVESAVDIQRRLVRHRHDSGFAPKVRIGLHTAEATREGGNYHGSGVHIASRIGAAASGEQILISDEAVAAAGKLPYELADAGSLDLKGVAQPVSARSLDWS